MIKTLRIQNFQSHPETVFEMHPGINAIVGDSDKGKSAALRALFWAATNKPTGDAHVSDWCKTDKGSIKKGQECRVTVIQNNGRTCSRIRSGELNGYEVDGILCEAIRTEIPAEASEFFNFSEVNVQRQADPPFLLAAPAGEVARFFNRIIKLEEIDQVLGLVDGRRRKTKAEIEATVAECNETRKKLDEMYWVDDVVQLVEKADALYKQITDTICRRDIVSTLLQEYRAQAEKLQAAEALKDAGVLVAKAKKFSDDLVTVSKSVNLAAGALREYRAQAAAIAAARPVAEKGPEIVARGNAALAQLVAVDAKSKELAGQLAQYYRSNVSLEMRPALVAAGERCGKAQKLLPRIENKRASIRQTAAEIANMRTASTSRALAEKDLAALVLQRPKTCPTCGRPWEAGHAE